MANELHAEPATGTPGVVRLTVTGDQMSGSIVRLDAAAEAQPVRNFSGVAAGSPGEVVFDCEPPLGRMVVYQLLDALGQVVALSGPVTCTPLPGNKGLLRSVLRPRVSWLEVEPQDETGVEWATTTTVHTVVGSDTPTVVGEVRQRRSGTITFLCRSIEEADRLLRLTADGTLLLLRVDPCAAAQVRDLLFYPLGVSERRWGRQGWRLISVDYQATKFVPGETEEPDFEWNFGALQLAATDFAGLTGIYRNFGNMALDVRNST